MGSLEVVLKRDLFGTNRTDAVEDLLLQLYDQPELLKRLMNRKKPGK